ncbi:MAG TPA: CHC2 zinc finger domain-containing protein [Streptosporangiaceae bacterium]
MEGQDWKPVRRIARGRLLGLCPLPADRKPSFLLDPNKNLFYCYGCGRGGDVIRFAELYHGVPFGEASALLRRWSGADSLRSDVINFYQVQLHRHPEAVAYLAERGVRQPESVEQMRLGYAPGRCLRAWWMSRGYALRDLQQAGVVTLEGFDALLIASSFRSTPTSTDAALATPTHIDSCPAARVGHAPIQTTMVYVSITPQDVYQQYVRAAAQLVRPVPPAQP